MTFTFSTCLNVSQLKFWNFFFKIFSKKSKNRRKLKKKHVFDAFQPFAHFCLCYFKLFSSCWCSLKKSNSKKYVFDLFVPILYFLILFLSNRIDINIVSKKTKNKKIRKLIIKIRNKMHKWAKNAKQDNKGLK